jgi:hypothetical protein
VVRCDVEWMVRRSEWVGILRRYTIYFDASACAKDANYNQTNRIARSFYFSIFILKLIGADHGLYTSGGVQISCLTVILRIVVGLRSTLKDTHGLEFRQASLLRVEP